jgi:hypothetical protein
MFQSVYRRGQWKMHRGGRRNSTREMTRIEAMNRLLDHTGPKAPINRTHSKRFAPVRALCKRASPAVAGE